jgi:hypothetical protein
MEREYLWRWWRRDEPETGLLGFHYRQDRDDFSAGKPGPFRRRVSEDGRTISQTEGWDGMLQRMCDGAAIERRSLKQLN